MRLHYRDKTIGGVYGGRFLVKPAAAYGALPAAEN